MRSLRVLGIASGFSLLAACSAPQQPAPPLGTVTDHLPTVSQLVAGTGFVYWSQLDSAQDDSWSIRRVASTGGTPEIVAGGIHEAQGMALDAANLYFTDGQHSLFSVPLDGSAAPVAIVTGLASPTQLVVLGRTAYVIESFGWFSAAVDAVDLDGGTLTQIDKGALAGLVTDGTSAYYLSDSIAPAGWASTLERFTPGDAAPTPVLSFPQMVDNLQVDGKNAYVLMTGQPEASSPDTLFMEPLAGGTPVTLATGLGPATPLVVSNAAAFWVESGGVWASTLGGGEPGEVWTLDAGDSVSRLAPYQATALEVVTTAQGDVAIAVVGI